MGKGSAKIMLNDKVILLRSVLHVPQLQEPLYSLRRHSQMPECGYFSSFDTGSHLLFPTFVLEIDTSIDNILDFQSIGPSHSSGLDYAEPREYPKPKARPATLIPPDTDTLDHLSVSFNIPTPKSGSPPPKPPSPPVPSPTPSPEHPRPPSPTSVITDEELISASSKPLSAKVLTSLHKDPSNLPPVPTAHTPGPAEHRIFGSRRFKNQNHLIAASSNAQLIKSGELPPTLGDFATINNPAKGKPLSQPRKYLDKVHLDIVFGDCLALGGFRYAIVLVDVATRYCWVFGMQALTSNEIISALNSFTSIAGMVPKTFHSDFDQKLIGGKARKWILEAGSRIIAAPSNRQSSNGLVERSWQTMVRMARAYITEKQVGREFWYFAIRHAAQIIKYLAV
jgi:hypothetical protein